LLPCSNTVGGALWSNKALWSCRKDAKNDDISVKIIVGGITNRLYRLMWGDKVRAGLRPRAQRAGGPLTPAV
jgi:hypothetical protein